MRPAATRYSMLRWTTSNDLAVLAFRGTLNRDVIRSRQAQPVRLAQYGQWCALNEMRSNTVSAPHISQLANVSS
jgi:hypothetical protein